MVTLYNCFSFNEEWYLVEMGLAVPPEEIDFEGIVVPEEGVDPDDWQAVLAEQFLNDDGTERLCELYDTPEPGASESRVAFFIYKSEARILRTPYGEFELSDAEETPDRLRDIIEVDEDYM